MTGSRLAALLDQTTPGPWIVQNEPPWIAGHIDHDDARLIALAPDMARLLVDMAETLTEITDVSIIGIDTWETTNAEELLARFAALDEKAGGA